jgi:hypothetical protein
MLDIYAFFSEDWYLDRFFTSESSLGRRESESIVEISTVTYESPFFFWYFECDVEIAISISSSMAFPAHLDTHTIFDTTRDLDIFFYSDIGVSFSMTRSTLFCDLDSSPVTCQTLTSLLDDTKNCPYLLTHLTLSPAGMTGFGFSTVTITVLTESTLFVLDFSHVPTDCVLE